VQYASHDYTRLLQQHDVRISMSRTAAPYDNAQAESFIKTPLPPLIEQACRRQGGRRPHGGNRRAA
jgi:transposase InsO family protein